MNLSEKIAAFREAGQTQRCHTMQYHGTYNVAIHCFNALSLLFLLYPEEPSTVLIKAVLWHDIPERWTGDIPTTTKMSSPELKILLDGIEQRILSKLDIPDLFKLTKTQRQWLDAIDLLELYLWVLDQQALGNLTTIPMQKQIHNIFLKRKDNIPKEVWNIYENFIWHRAAECNKLLED